LFSLNLVDSAAEAREEINMTDPQRSRVRGRDGAFAERTSAADFFREVGAPLLQKKILSGSSVTIEWMERQGGGLVDWRHRQDRDALFYFERGVVACYGALDGNGINRRLSGESKLAFVEAGSTVEMEVKVPGRCIYWVAFIDRKRLLGEEKGLNRCRPVSRIGFNTAPMALAMDGLRAELARSDELSSLYLESWAIQTLVLLHRSSDRAASPLKAGLGKNEISRVVEFMEANIRSDLKLSSLANLIDVSPRHLRRLFLAATGMGPNAMLTNIRLERAAQDLRYSRKSVTDISLDCGFSQPQHLATAFRRKFGLTPTAFRQSTARQASAL
jgi:AraC-like DNA-binding protein